RKPPPRDEPARVHTLPWPPEVILPNPPDLMAKRKKQEEPDSRPIGERFARTFAPPELYDPDKRRQWKLGSSDADRGPYVIELNLQHVEGVKGASMQLDALLRE